MAPAPAPTVAPLPPPTNVPLAQYGPKLAAEGFSEDAGVRLPAQQRMADLDYFAKKAPELLATYLKDEPQPHLPGGKLPAGLKIEIEIKRDTQEAIITFHGPHSDKLDLGVSVAVDITTILDKVAPPGKPLEASKPEVSKKRLNAAFSSIVADHLEKILGPGKVTPPSGTPAGAAVTVPLLDALAASKAAVDILKTATTDGEPAEVIARLDKIARGAFGSTLSKALAADKISQMVRTPDDNAPKVVSGLGIGQQSTRENGWVVTRCEQKSGFDMYRVYRGGMTFEVAIRQNAESTELARLLVLFDRTGLQNTPDGRSNGQIVVDLAKANFLIAGVINSKPIEFTKALNKELGSIVIKVGPHGNAVDLTGITFDGGSQVSIHGSMGPGEGGKPIGPSVTFGDVRHRSRIFVNDMSLTLTGRTSGSFEGHAHNVNIQSKINSNFTSRVAGFFASFLGTINFLDGAVQSSALGKAGTLNLEMTGTLTCKDGIHGLLGVCLSQSVLKKAIDLAGGEKGFREAGYRTTHRGDFGLSSMEQDYLVSEDVKKVKERFPKMRVGGLVANALGDALEDSGAGNAKVHRMTEWPGKPGPGATLAARVTFQGTEKRWSVDTATDHFVVIEYRKNISIEHNGTTYRMHGVLNPVAEKAEVERAKPMKDFLARQNEMVDPLSLSA